MSRIPELNRDQLDAEGLRLYDEILAACGSIAGPFRTVAEETFHLLLEAVGKKAAVEVTGLYGYYTMVAMTLNSFCVGGDADANPPIR